MKYIVLKQCSCGFSHDIEVVANGGTCSVDKITRSIGDYWNLPEISRNGYIFGGWYKESTFNTRITNDDIVDETEIIYAKWIEWGDNYTEFIVIADSVDQDSFAIYHITRKSSSSCVYVDWVMAVPMN